MKNLIETDDMSNFKHRLNNPIYNFKHLVNHNVDIGTWPNAIPNGNLQGRKVRRGNWPVNWVTSTLT